MAGRLIMCFRQGELRKNDRTRVAGAGILQSACDRGKKLPSGIIECEIKNERLVLLQLHGGGYIGGMRNAYRSFWGYTVNLAGE